MKIRKALPSALVFLAVCLITACSGGGDSPPATATDQGQTATVVANAGPPQSVFIGTVVTLNGSGSTTTNSKPLSYSWTMKTKPAGSAAVLSNTTIVNPKFTADIAGRYECNLVVTDGVETSAPSSVTIASAVTNPKPVAHAGQSRAVFLGRAVILDGSKSSDANGDSLTFRWTFTGRPAQSQASLSDANTVVAGFTPDVEGPYKIQLVVNDKTSDSAPASVIITASPVPPPMAHAGSNQVVLPNTLVRLNGNQSTGDGLTYQWSLTPPPGVTATLTNLNTANPTFTPTVVGLYTAQLIVKDSTGATSAPSTVTITVGVVADAGDVQTVSVNVTVQLDGSGSFGNSLRYAWAFMAVPGSTTPAFSPSNSVVNPTFSANVEGTYRIELSVTDSVGQSDSATTTVTARTGPVANFTFAPPNPEVNATVSLTNTSTGTSLEYAWLFASRPANSKAEFLPNASAKDPSFVTDLAGNYDVTLTVRDTVTGVSDTTTPPKRIMAISPPPINIPPTAKINVTTPLPANVCSTVELSGTSSFDPDGSVESYAWTLTLPNGSAAPLSSSSTAEFKADKADAFNVRLVVTDNLGAPSLPVNMDITPQPNADGKKIYDEDGLPGMIPVGTFGGPKCMACHRAGNHDASGSTLTNVDLNLPIYTVQRIKDELMPALGFSHLGTHTNLVGDELTKKITALRQFLDSTLTNCP